MTVGKRAAMAGYMLNHGQYTAAEKSVAYRLAQRRDQRRVVGEGTVTDDFVTAFHG